MPTTIGRKFGQKMPTNAEQGVPSVDDVLDLNPTSFVDDVYNAVRVLPGGMVLRGGLVG